MPWLRSKVKEGKEPTGREVIATITPIIPAVEAGLSFWQWSYANRDEVNEKLNSVSGSNYKYDISRMGREAIALHIADQLPDREWTLSIANSLNDFTFLISTRPALLENFNQLMLYRESNPKLFPEDIPNDLKESVGMWPFIDLAEYIIADEMPIYR